MINNTGDDMQTETIQEFLARGGKITKQPETRIPTWSEAYDELVKLAWHTYVPPQPEVVEEAEW